MKKLLRRILNGFALLSAILFLGIIVIWIRSYFAGDGWVWKPSSKTPDYYCLYIGHGGVRYGWGLLHFDTEKSFYYSPTPPTAYPTMMPTDGLGVSLGFDYTRDIDTNGMPYSNLVFPLWFAAMIALILPVWRGRAMFVPRRARQRVAEGCCVRCGYDLRASGDQCPECGAVSVR